MDNNNMNNNYQQPTQPTYDYSAANTYTYAENTTTETVTEGKNGAALWGMILGIASVVCCSSGIVGLILGIIGLILSIKGKKKLPEKKGMAITGLITSIVGIVFGVIFTLVLLLGGGATLLAFLEEM